MKGALKEYKIEGRAAIVERVARGAKAAVDTLITAAEQGDVRASEILLKKVLPDLKSIDLNQSGDGVKIIINQKIYPGKRAHHAKVVEMPSVTINVSEGLKKEEHRTIDVTDHVKVSKPPESTPPNYKVERSKGKFK